MNMSLNFLYVLSCHWLCDFVLQTYWQASNKSHNNKALFDHVVTYSIGMMGLMLPMVCWEFLQILKQNSDYVLKFGQWTMPLFLLITFVTHFCTDWITSRITSKLYAKERTHDFFVVIGFDQLIHQATLLATLLWLGLLV